MSSKIIASCCEVLVGRSWKISFVESASAGRLSYEFSLDANSGKVLLGGLVSYDASMKEDLLNIPRTMLEQFTPESAEVTRAMAESFKKISNADVCVAITGLTTPGGSESAEKPVGTIFTHILLPDHAVADRTVFEGSHEKIVSQAVERIVGLIINAAKS